MPAQAADEIMLTLPRDRSFRAVAQLVLGGLASRRRVTVEGLEDLRIALDSLLERREGADEMTLTLRVTGDAIETSVGPFRAGVRDELMREPGGDVGLRRILETVSDRVELAEEAGGHWVRLTTALGPGTAAS